MRILVKIILLLIFSGSLAQAEQQSCDVNKLVEASFKDVRHIETVLPIKISDLKGGLMPFKIPPANTPYNIFVSFKQMDLVKQKTVEMVQVYYFDVDCSLAGEMGRAVFSEGDPRIIEFH